MQINSGLEGLLHNVLSAPAGSKARPLAVPTGFTAVSADALWVPSWAVLRRYQHAANHPLLPCSATPHTPPKAGTPLGHRASGRLDSGALNPGGAEQEAYFAELLGHPLERLSKEPELLAEDQKQLRRQTQVKSAEGLGYHALAGVIRAATQFRVHA